MEKIMRLTYASSLNKLCEVNSSFDSGVLKIAYHGNNRNKSNISKAAFEKSIKTIYNCPIVCNYDIESDSFGGHDVDIVRDDDGNVRLINCTSPVGVIPESARYWWSVEKEEDGKEHEYLFADALLWKRQPAYKKIKEDGVVAHSMEIEVKNGELVDGVYNIYDFEFTAFCLIGVEPCFEGSSIQMFDKKEFKCQLAEMMQELKDNYDSVTSFNKVDDTHPQNNSTEGGLKVLEEKQELVAKYGTDISTLDYSIEDFSVEELEEKFKLLAETANKEEEPKEDEEKFELTSNIIDEVCMAIHTETVETEYGTMNRYFYVDCDLEKSEVYCWDTTDWLLYGFTYSLNGDAVTVDFACKKRMKYTIVEFDNGEQASPFAETFEKMGQKIRENADINEKYQQVSGELESLNSEVEELRQYKLSSENEKAIAERNDIFAQFEDLSGIEEFEKLVEDCLKYDTDSITEKCYAIRGKNGTSAKFSVTKEPILKVPAHADDEEDENEPYSGIFKKYGF